MSQIPKALRNKVWNQYVGIEKGISKCFVCTDVEISQQNFECGHIISRKNGGQLTIENLRPICGACNKSIGSNNMDEFMTKYGYAHNLKQNTKQIPILKKNDNENKSIDIRKTLNQKADLIRNFYRYLLKYHEYKKIKNDYTFNDFIDVKNKLLSMNLIKYNQSNLDNVQILHLIVKFGDICFYNFDCNGELVCQYGVSNIDDRIKIIKFLMNNMNIYDDDLRKYVNELFS